MPDEPTVLVKKADGTYERVNLSELKKQMSKKPTADGNLTRPPKAAGLPKPTGEAGLARGVSDANFVAAAPARKNLVKTGATGEQKSVAAKKLEILQPERFADIKTEKLAAPTANRADYADPLEEPLSTPGTFAASLASDPRNTQVETVLKKINLSVPKDLESRLRTIIQLCLKDVRTEEQTRESLTRRQVDGGMGLSGEQAKTVIIACAEAVSGAGGALASVPVPNLRQLKNAAAEKNLPENESDFTTVNKMMRVKSLSVIAPTRSEQVAATAARPSPVLPTASQLTRVRRAERPASEAEPTLKLSSAPRARPVMQDILPPEPAEMGPVDEIRYLTLTDFRRLAPTPEEEAARFKQKFLNLREESVILFFKALDAWRQSPLYADYVGALGKSLASGVKLGEGAGDRSAIRLSEMKSIADMEQALSL